MHLSQDNHRHQSIHLLEAMDHRHNSQLFHQAAMEHLLAVIHQVEMVAVHKEEPTDIVQVVHQPGLAGKEAKVDILRVDQMFQVQFNNNTLQTGDTNTKNNENRFRISINTFTAFDMI